MRVQCNNCKNDFEQQAFLTNCPHCQMPLYKSNAAFPPLAAQPSTDDLARRLSSLSMQQLQTAELTFSAAACSSYRPQEGSHHSASMPQKYQCPRCNQLFGQELDLRKHYATHFA